MGWSDERSFFDLHAHNFVRVSTCVPRVFLGDPERNAVAILELYERAVADGSSCCVFPELCVCGYALDDLLQQDAIQAEVLTALDALRRGTKAGRAVLVVGAPLRVAGRLYNCAVVLHGAQVLGVVPKSYLPNFREFYEARQFVSAREAEQHGGSFPGAFLGQSGVPFRPDVVFRCAQNGSFCVGVEVCQDVWVPVPPSTFQAFAGATVLCNLSASNITIDKSRYRHALVASQSSKNYCAYLYTSAGAGESTNDLAWDGQAVLYECGDLLGESARFCDDAAGQVLHGDVDLDRIEQDRSRDMTWSQNGRDLGDRVAGVRVVDFDLSPGHSHGLGFRVVPKRPYVPSDAATLTERCYECYNIQVSGLVQRLRSCGLKKVVIGVSGGLDSTHALLVICQALDKLGYPRANCLAYTMPGFATSDATKSYALELMDCLGVSAETLDIRPACEVMLKDLGHPYARGLRGREVYDVTFENVQAGERTNHLFRLANHNGAFVVGTGDLSELALGWCTYGVGDHMSHYGVNASVPKSLIQCVIQWVIRSDLVGARANAVLKKILAVEISPELVPQEDAAASKNGEDKEAKMQSTEDALGPYDLHDFQLYMTTRRGFGPSKAAFLAMHAWADDGPDTWEKAHFPPEAAPSLSGADAVLKDRQFPLAKILDVQRTFLRRFFLTSQFKRTCVPNAPKVGDGGSLSPRGDWRAPSDASWGPWQRNWHATVKWARASATKDGHGDLAADLAALDAAYPAP